MVREIEEKREMKRRPVATEHQEQAALVQWFESYARTRGMDSRMLIAIPNAQILMGTAKNPAGALAYLRAEGLRAGVPDLFLAYPLTYRRLVGGRLGGEKMKELTVMVSLGLWIEMKRKGAKSRREFARPEQLAYASLLRRVGYHVVIAHGFEEAQRAIRAYVEYDLYESEPCGF